MRRIQVVDGGYKRQENPHRTEHRSAIQASQLFLEHIRVFQTKPETPHAQIHVHAVPALLVDSHVDRAEGDRRALRGLQYDRVIRNEGFLIRLLALAEEIELGSVQPDRLAAYRNCRSHFFTEIDVGSE